MRVYEDRRGGGDISKKKPNHSAVHSVLCVSLFSVLQDGKKEKQPTSKLGVVFSVHSGTSPLADDFSIACFVCAFPLSLLLLLPLQVEATKKNADSPKKQIPNSLFFFAGLVSLPRPRKQTNKNLIKFLPNGED